MKLFTATVALFAISLDAAPLEKNSIEDHPELSASYIDGDIVPEIERNGLRNEVYRWPDGIVYYKFHSFDDDHRNHIRQGMKTIEDVSCIRFKEADSNQSYYINITGISDGCYASLGWTNGVRVLNLKNFPVDIGCFRLGIIVHEFLHLLGFYHQQSASDRDNYVRIVEENIEPGREKAFRKIDELYIDDFGVGYDYGSVMHYPPYAFSKNGEKTIVALNESDDAGRMGQRDGMSKKDIDKLNIMYRCVKPL